jgi:hypothetical protein
MKGRLLHFEENLPSFQPEFSTLPNSFHSVFRVLAQLHFPVLRKEFFPIFLPRLTLVCRLLHCFGIPFRNYAKNCSVNTFINVMRHSFASFVAPAERSLIEFFIYKEEKAIDKIPAKANQDEIVSTFRHVLSDAKQREASFIIGLFEALNYEQPGNRRRLSVALWDVAQTSLPTEAHQLPNGIYSTIVWYRTVPRKIIKWVHTEEGETDSSKFL